MKAAFRAILPPTLAVATLYGLNRLVLIPHSGGPLHRLFAWYGNDVLAGVLMLSFLNAMLAAAGRKQVHGIVPATLFLLVCGLFWEYVTPLYLPRSVSDPWDLLAYWTGGMLLLLCYRFQTTLLQRKNTAAD